MDNLGFLNILGQHEIALGFIILFSFLILRTCVICSFVNHFNHDCGQTTLSTLNSVDHGNVLEPMLILILKINVSHNNLQPMLNLY
jgi:hypothetical protein